MVSHMNGFLKSSSVGKFQPPENVHLKFKEFP